MDTTNISQKRVAIIGTGPAGMSTLVAFKKAQQAGEAVPELVAFEKQDQPGGLWNYTWRTGLDEFGQPVHSSMYQQLFSNAPKELLEYRDYTHMDHFGKPVSSYPPRESLHDYIIARFDKYQCRDQIRTNTVVTHISFSDDTQKFTVQSQHLKDKTESSEEFDYVICATGHFWKPKMPYVEGFEDFRGRIMHSHEVRNAEDFKDLRVLVVGTSYSAEDIASMIWKNGGKHIVTSYRTKPFPFTWPDDKFTVKPLIKSLKGQTATFADGSTEQIDAVVMCTGYQHDITFMEKKLRLTTGTQLYADQNYKNVLWQSNPKLMYLGMHDQTWTLPLFDTQAWYCRDVVLGKIVLPPAEERQKNIDEWITKMRAIDGKKAMVEFHGAYIEDMQAATDYPNIDTEAQIKIFIEWVTNKYSNIMTFRDQVHTSTITNVTGAAPKTPWLQQFDTSKEQFLENH